MKKTKEKKITVFRSVTVVVFYAFGYFCGQLTKQISYVREETVHPQTLNATLKEAMKDGKNIPVETFAVMTGTTVEIK